MAKHLHIEGGTLSVNFNGGTLKANSEYSINGGLIHSDVTVFVGAGGGTIDSDNLDITVSAAISGNGGMTFKGGGSVTLASGNTYTGTTTVEVGTTVHIPSASALQSSKIEVTVPETAPEVAVYTPVIIDGDGTLPSTILDDIELPRALTMRRRRACLIWRTGM